MAYDVAGLVVPFIGSGDLSDQYGHFAKMTTSANTVALAVANTDKIIGVFASAGSTATGGAVSVQVNGIAKCAKDSTSVAVELDDICACSTEGGVEQSTGGNTVYVIGTCLEAMAAATTGLVSVLITHNGYGSTLT